MRFLELLIPQINERNYLHVEEECSIDQFMSTLKNQYGFSSKKALLYNTRSGRFLPDDGIIGECDVESGDTLMLFGNMCDGVLKWT